MERKDVKELSRLMQSFHLSKMLLTANHKILDFIKVYLDFRNTSCVLTEFGSYAARNMFP